MTTVLSDLQMPEGDTIHYAANRIRPVLAGRVPDEIAAPHPRFARDRWEERLAGRAVQAVEAHGKHLFLRFEGDLTIHSHLRMNGAWKVVRTGAPWRRGRHHLWFRARAGDHEVLQFDGPLLELLTETRRRFDLRLARLGPDIIREDFDEQRFVRRLREDDPTRPIGDALLNQETLAGVGNIWKSEGCFDAEIDPWRVSADVSDDEALAIVRAARPRMQRSAREGFAQREIQVYGRAGRRCPRCGATIRSAGQGENNRTTFWCPECQK